MSASKAKPSACSENWNKKPPPALKHQELYKIRERSEKMAKPYAVLRKEAIADLTAYMDSLDEKQASKLAYWLKDYARFLKQEQTFDPKKLIRYKRGSIIKVHLGYRIGSEEGGLHYAIVLDKKNALSSPIVTVIPLTSVKPTTNVNQLPYTNVFLGNEVYQQLSDKCNREIAQAQKTVNDLQERYAKAETPEDKKRIQDEALIEKTHIDFCKKIMEEIRKMKTGSIALVGQITTISKQRIYDPQYRNDILSGLSVSDEILDKLDAKMLELFGSA